MRLALFFSPPAALFGYADGTEWGVSHFRMKARSNCYGATRAEYWIARHHH